MRMTETMNTALTGVTTGDWLAAGVGTLFGIVATVVAVMIARWQRRTQVRDRVQDRAERQSEDQHLTRPDSRQFQYLETSEVLRLAQRVEWRVRNEGPFTESGLEELHLTKLVMDAEQLAARCPERLREPLELLAVSATQLRQTAVRSSSASVTTRDDLRSAIEQDRAAHELAAATRIGWSAMKEEWSS